MQDCSVLKQKNSDLDNELSQSKLDLSYKNEELEHYANLYKDANYNLSECQSQLENTNTELQLSKQQLNAQYIDIQNLRIQSQLMSDQKQQQEVAFEALLKQTADIRKRLGDLNFATQSDIQEVKSFFSVLANNINM